MKEKRKSASPLGVNMPQDHVPLTLTENGELGPSCRICAKRMTFGEAMVHNQHYFCWEHYREQTGVDSATSTRVNENPFYRAKD